MTPDRLQECLEALNWTRELFLRIVRVRFRDERTVRRLLTGEEEIREDLAEWIEHSLRALTGNR